MEENDSQKAKSGPRLNPQASKRHHYIPEFYTRSWARADGTLIQWSRPYQIVVPQTVHPKATGFVNHLYALCDFPPEAAHVIEDAFFKPIDTNAADAVALLKRHGTRANLNERLRYGWTELLISLEMRTPEDLTLLRKLWPDLMTAWALAREPHYQSFRLETAPPTYVEYHAGLPTQEQEKLLFHTLMTLIENRELSDFIANMFWTVIDTSWASAPLLTSDRPVVRSNGIRTPFGNIAIPLSPTKLFVATHTIGARTAILARPIEDLVQQMNLTVVRGAQKYVYSSDESLRQLIVQNIGAAIVDRQLQISILRHIEALKSGKYS